MEFSSRWLFLFFPIAFLISCVNAFALHRLNWHDRKFGSGLGLKVSLFVLLLSADLFILLGGR